MVHYQVRDVIKIAIKLEKEHQKLFEEMLVSFAKGQVSAKSEGLSGYLNVVGTVIQPSKSIEEIMHNITTVDEALDFAIDKEKEAMAFYSDLKMKVNEESQRIIEEILNRENQYIHMLMEEKNKLGL